MGGTVPVRWTEPDCANWFSSLEGRWRLARKMSNGCRFEGEAVFTPLDRYVFELKETGKLLLADGTALPATQNWVWRQADNNKLIVEYSQARGGAEYHMVLMQSAGKSIAGTGEHTCGADLYLARYRLMVCGSRDVITIRHRITGPAKNYRIATRMTRTFNDPLTRCLP